MSALDQAFIKAYSQQNPVLASAAVETAKAGSPRDPAMISATAENATSIATADADAETVQAVSLSKGTKERSARKTKLPGKPANHRLSKVAERRATVPTKSSATAKAKKPAAANEAKKPKTSTACTPPRATQAKTLKKPSTKPKRTPAPPAIENFAQPAPTYRLDAPVSKTGGGILKDLRSVVPSPHTDAIFAEMENLLPRRELATKQAIAPAATADTIKSVLDKKAEPAAETKPSVTNPMASAESSQNPLPPSYVEAWTEGFKRTLSKFEQAPSSSEPPKNLEEDSAKSPVELFQSLSASMKQYTAAQLPSEENSAREEEPVSPNSYFQEKIAALENKKSPPEQSEMGEKRNPAEKINVSETRSAPAIRLFQPMLQVEHFAWPKVCGKLETAASAELDRILETLTAAQLRGQKVFALAGCRSGEGATSLLLATARRLATQGMKAALIEADWSQPQLARRLGLLPQYGWEDVLLGRLPLEEVLIESIAERLVILPVREPFRASDMPAEAASRLAETWNSLRHHFDIVLVDPGPLANSPILDKQFIGVMAGRIDATLLVKNLRHQDNPQDSGEFDAAVQAMNNAGARVLGVVENFVG
jgi:Mrp family chromosome partitioning ATPase